MHLERYQKDKRRIIERIQKGEKDVELDKKIAKEMVGNIGDGIAEYYETVTDVIAEKINQ